MSHHFDNPSPDKDPRLNITDYYLFDGGPDTTVMAMAVNPMAGQYETGPFRGEEGLYAFRFDTDGDRVENVTFKVRFSEPIHVDRGNGHAQRFEVVVATGADATAGDRGEALATGLTGEEVAGTQGVRAYAGTVFDAFTASSGKELDAFRAAFERGEFFPEAYRNSKNGFDGRPVGVIVLEVPNALLGGNGAQVRTWGTISLHGHAPEQQVNRWGVPLFTDFFVADGTQDIYNRTAPSDDNTAVISAARSQITRYVRLARTSPNPEAYADRLLAILDGGLTLPYTLGTTASFDFAGINGRGLADNVMDTVMTLLTNYPLGTGVEPNPERWSTTFPYFVEFQ